MNKVDVAVSCILLVSAGVSAELRAEGPRLASKAQQQGAQDKLTRSVNNPNDAAASLWKLKKAGLSLVFTVDWSRWDLGKYPDPEQIIMDCEGAIDGIQQLHEIQGWKQALDKRVRTFECRPDGTHALTNEGSEDEMYSRAAKDMELSGSAFIYHVPPQNPANIAATTVYALQRDLANERVDGLTVLQYQAKATCAESPDGCLTNLKIVNQACGTHIEASLDWAHWDMKEWGESTVGWETARNYCDDTLDGIRAYCHLHGDDAANQRGQKLVQQKIKKVECRFDGKAECSTVKDQSENAEALLKDVELKGSTFVMHVHKGQCEMGTATTFLKKTFGE